MDAQPFALNLRFVNETTATGGDSASLSEGGEKPATFRAERNCGFVSSSDPSSVLRSPGKTLRAICRPALTEPSAGVKRLRLIRMADFRSLASSVRKLLLEGVGNWLGCHRATLDPTPARRRTFGSTGQVVGSRRLWRCLASGAPHHRDVAAMQELANETERMVRKDGLAPHFGKPGTYAKRPQRFDGRAPEMEPEADAKRMPSAVRSLD